MSKQNKPNQNKQTVDLGDLDIDAVFNNITTVDISEVSANTKKELRTINAANKQTALQALKADATKADI